MKAMTSTATTFAVLRNIIKKRGSNLSFPLIFSQEEDFIHPSRKGSLRENASLCLPDGKRELTN